MKKKIQANILKKVFKELLYLKELLNLCTKKLRFTFNSNIYIQCDGVAMGSPLAPSLANVFKISLEEDLIPTLNSFLWNWKRYIDDTNAYVEPTKVEFILTKLDNYHHNINFAYELEKNNDLKFLVVLIKRVNNNKLQTGVY